MSTYQLLRSQVFCFAETAEVIIHLPDFALAKLKPPVVAFAVGDVTVPMKVVGMGNQQGKLAVRLATADTELFERARGALQDESAVLTISLIE
jgi:hypothetical protein